MELGPLGIEFRLCKVCKGVYDICWMEEGTCINCWEIDEHGCTMGCTMGEDYN